MRSVEGCLLVSLAHLLPVSAQETPADRQTHFQLTLTEESAEIKDINQVDVPNSVTSLEHQHHVIFEWC